MVEAIFTFYLIIIHLISEADWVECFLRYSGPSYLRVAVGLKDIEGIKADLARGM